MSAPTDTKRIGVYLAHPRPGSFNHAVFEAVVDELRGRGCEVLAHDLCAEGFPPVLTAEETGTVAAAPVRATPDWRCTGRRWPRWTHSSWSTPTGGACRRPS